MLILNMEQVLQIQFVYKYKCQSVMTTASLSHRLNFCFIIDSFFFKCSIDKLFRCPSMFHLYRFHVLTKMFNEEKEK